MTSETLRPQNKDGPDREEREGGGGGGGGDLYCVFSLFPLLGSSYPVPPCVCVASSVFSRFSRSFYSSFYSSLPLSLSYHKEEKKKEEEDDV